MSPRRLGSVTGATPANARRPVDWFGHGVGHGRRGRSSRVTENGLVEVEEQIAVYPDGWNDVEEKEVCD